MIQKAHIGRGFRGVLNYVFDESAERGHDAAVILDTNMAGRTPRELAAEFGAQCVVVAIDARRRDDGWEVCTHGGATPTGIDALEWAAGCEVRGAGELLVTSMDRDGTREGFDLELTRAVVDAVGVPVIASGGVGTLEHLAEGALEGGADAVLAASIFHFAEHSIRDAKAYLARRGVPVRP